MKGRRREGLGKRRIRKREKDTNMHEIQSQIQSSGLTVKYCMTDNWAHTGLLCLGESVYRPF